MPRICGMSMGQTALLPFRRKACWGIFRPKNPKNSAGSEPAILGTRGQHANHQTTEAATAKQLLASQVGLRSKELVIFLRMGA
jgi:hypothetical protein